MLGVLYTVEDIIESSIDWAEVSTDYVRHWLPQIDEPNKFSDTIKTGNSFYKTQSNEMTNKYAIPNYYNQNSINKNLLIRPRIKPFDEI